MALTTTLTPAPKGTPKRRIPKAEINQFVGEAVREIQKKNPKSNVNTDLALNTIKYENGGPGKDGQYAVKDAAYEPRKKDGIYAWGMCQMYPEFVADAHRYLTGETLSGDALMRKWEEVVQDPQKSVRYMVGGYASIDQRVMGWSVVKEKVHDPDHLRAILSAAYHLGEDKVQPLVNAACEDGPFNITKFTELYEGASARAEHGKANRRVRDAAGIGGSPNPDFSGGSGGAPMQVVNTGPTDADAKANTQIPLSFDVSDSTPTTPLTIVQEGLDMAAWFDDSPYLPGKLTANPHLRGLPPAWFELRLNRTDGTSLTNTRTGEIIKVILNVSLTSVNIHSQHLVNREPTATGLMISFWGSQPDMITGRGTTGAFINQTGLTAIMSNRLTPEASGWWDLIQQAYGKREMKHWDQTSTGMNKAAMNIMWGLEGKGVNRFRVAAQDAFAELLALFKNNGVLRFLPKSHIAQADPKALAEAEKNAKIWSPAAGSTGFQMLARAGDVYSRGYVAFKYKGATYLGYFKSFNFTADAKTPFKWDFDFTFRVLRSHNPFYYPTSAKSPNG